MISSADARGSSQYGTAQPSRIARSAIAKWQTLAKHRLLSRSSSLADAPGPSESAGRVDRHRWGMLNAARLPYLVRRQHDAPQPCERAAPSTTCLDMKKTRNSKSRSARTQLKANSPPGSERRAG